MHSTTCSRSLKALTLISTGSMASSASSTNKKSVSTIVLSLMFCSSMERLDAIFMTWLKCSVYNDFSELAEPLCEVFGDIYAVHKYMRSFSKIPQRIGAFWQKGNSQRHRLLKQCHHVSVIMSGFCSVSNCGYIVD